MSKFGRRIKQAPEGYDYIEPTLTALENELREKVNEPHEGLRKNESQWPVHQINWQKTRYIYDMYYTYHRISKELYDYCIINKIVDAALIAKWKKPGYERLCSTYVINPRNYKFGTVSICRVPKHCLAPGTEIEDPMTGCRGCASGSSSNIFGNKYGQYLAAIQVAREERLAQKKALQAQLLAQQAAEDAEDEEDNDDSEQEYDQDSDKDGGEDSEEDLGPVALPDGSSAPKKKVIWASAEQEQNIALDDAMIGELAPEAKREAMQAMSKASLKSAGSHDLGPPGKRSRPN